MYLTTHANSYFCCINLGLYNKKIFFHRFLTCLLKNIDQDIKNIERHNRLKNKVLSKNISFSSNILYNYSFNKRKFKVCTFVISKDNLFLHCYKFVNYKETAISVNLRFTDTIFHLYFWSNRFSNFFAIGTINGSDFIEFRRRKINVSCYKKRGTPMPGTKVPLPIALGHRNLQH